MKHLPLDEQLSNENERPAGPWLEAYWLQAATWAKRLALLLIVYLCFEIYLFSDFPTSSLVENHGFLTLVIGWLIPLGIMSYFILQFGRMVSSGVKFKNQRMLEDGFRQLRYVLIIAIILAGITLLEDAFFTYMQL